MKKTILIIVTALTVNLVFAQNKQNYPELVSEAFKLYKNKDYLNSAYKYSEAFAALGGKGLIDDRYNAACSWALAGQPDSSFIHLFKIVNSGYYTNYDHITTDADLNSLHPDKRWQELISIVKLNQEKAEAKLEKPLVALLDTIFKDDQQGRMQINETIQKYGRDSKEVKELWKIINEKDSVNLIKITKILDERGWLGTDVIGNMGNQTLFLVIQHADLPTQEKYLPMMRDAVKEGNAAASNLALLEDRVALRQGRKQVYGSQIYYDEKTGQHYVAPLEDPDNVNKRRAEVGLGPIQDYLSNFELTWDVEEYKKQLPDLELKNKK